MGTNQVGAQFGAALAAGDFNSDGRVDLAIGIPFQDIPGGPADAGEVDVIYGSAAGGLSVSSHAPQFWQSTNPQAGARFGSSLTAWNFGRNETVSLLGRPFVFRIADLAVGAPYQSVSGVSGAGAVHVIYGSYVGNGLTSGSRATFSADSIGFGGLSGAHFGASLY